MLRLKRVIEAEKGLLVEPAGLLSSTALKYKCSVYLKIRNFEVNAKSVLGILSAKVKKGEEIELSISGEDEAACFDALNKCIDKINSEG